MAHIKNLTPRLFITAGIAMLMMLLMLSGNAIAQSGNQQQPDPTAVFKNQPAFTENELTKFLVDYEKARNMTDDQEAIEYLQGEGWTPDRIMYIAAKVGLTREVVRRGGTKDIINQLPKEVRPQTGELDLVKKHQSKIDKIFPSNGQ